MKKLLQLKTMLLLCALIVGSSSVWGQITIWSEDFSGYSAGDVPSGTISLPHTGTLLDASGTLTYGCTNGGGGGTTKIYDETSAGGTKPELLVAKKNGTFTATLPLNNISGTITLKYKQNAYALKVTMTADKLSASQSNSTAGEKTLTLENVTTSHTSLTIEFEATNSTKNVRLDNIILTGYKAAVAISSIAFSEPKTASVSVGGTTTLSPTVLPANHTEVVDWVSDATGVATVSSTGVVTGVAVGTAHITAKAHDNPSTIYDVCTVTVTAAIPVTGVSLKSSTTLLLGGTETLVATVSPNNATNKNVTWSSADGTKVSVDENGVITGVALTGGSPVNITVTTEDGSFEATCAVTVNPIPVSSVGLDKTSATLVVGNTLTLEASVLPDNATDKSVTWESDATDVATVDEDGKVTAVAEGTATITVKSVADPTKKAECTITVTDGSIELAPGSVITFNNFSGAGTGGYKTQKCELTASDSNVYEWSETNAYSNGGWQLKASTGNVTSPAIKTSYGFTITATMDANSVVISDGTNSGTNTLTTSKTNTSITISSTSNYARISSLTITALKLPIATDVTITNPGTLAKDATGTFEASSTDAADCTKTWSSNNDAVIEITNASTGAYEATGRGTAKITYTITPDDASTYRAVTAELNVSVTAPVVITASDVAMTYGDAAEAIGATTSAGYAGTLSYVSGNTNIATVDATGKVSAVAVGTTTITISAPADAENLYTAGEDKVINVTVSGPSAGITAAKYPRTADVYETLLSNATGWTYNNWTSSSSYGACSPSGSGTASQLITQDYTIPQKANPCVHFKHTGNVFSDPSSACKLKVQEGSGTPVELTIPNYFTGVAKDWTFVESGYINITDYRGKTVHFIFDYNPSSGNDGKWEVKYFGIYYDTFSVKLNASGYATFCSQYPLDFSDYAKADYSAWQVTGIDGTTITFSQVKDIVKGGTGLLLKGTANAFITLTSSDGDTVLSDNILVGTMAPTYVSTENDDYTNFGLSGGEFKKITSGVVPANKAYLPVLTSELPASGRLSIVFEEEETGIKSMRDSGMFLDNTVYNLSGQRVENPTKGLYIVNGRKVVVK